MHFETVQPTSFEQSVQHAIGEFALTCNKAEMKISKRE